MAERRAVFASREAKLRMTADGETIPNHKKAKNRPK